MVKDRSSLLEVMPGIIAKFELNNPAGSHKVRAARRIVKDAVAKGEIIPGKTTVIEKTGGNFGVGLALVCAELGIPVELAVGLQYSVIKRNYLTYIGARLIGVEKMRAGKSPKEIIDWHIRNQINLGRHYFYTNQFENPGSLLAHEEETGPEIANQLSSHWPEVKRIVFVSGAGTGASLTGIARSLRSAGYKVEVILVEPQGCNSREGIFVKHPHDGISVGIPPPFLDWSLVSQTISVSLREVQLAQREISLSQGYFIGNSSAACLAIAKQFANPSDTSQKVLTVIYDHGLWYMSSLQAS